MEEILNLIKEYIIDSKSSYDSYNDSSLNETLEEIEKLIENA